jgi:hypothetical protein
MGADESPFFHDCNSNGIADACEADDDGDGVTDDCDDCRGTIPGVPVDDAGCPPEVPGDDDRDGDVDQDDVNAFKLCVSGPAVPLTPGCEGKDHDGDSDVDQSDFAALQGCLSGAGIPADPGCG